MSERASEWVSERASEWVSELPYDSCELTHSELLRN